MAIGCIAIGVLAGCSFRTRGSQITWEGLGVKLGVQTDAVDVGKTAIATSQPAALATNP
jgi:hypothetical protein